MKKILMALLLIGTVGFFVAEGFVSSGHYQHACDAAGTVCVIALVLVAIFWGD